MPMLEIRRIDKISVSTNPLERIIVTDSWIILLGNLPFNFDIRLLQLSLTFILIFLMISIEGRSFMSRSHIFKPPGSF